MKIITEPYGNKTRNSWQRPQHLIAIQFVIFALLQFCVRTHFCFYNHVAFNPGCKLTDSVDTNLLLGWVVPALR